MRSQRLHFDGPVRLDDYRFTLVEAAALANVPDGSVRNWIKREVLQVGQLHFTGRHIFSLLDAVRLAAMHDLTIRVPLLPSDAVQAAEFLVREVVKRMPTDADGRPIADPNAIEPAIAVALAVVDGEMNVGLIDPTMPGYAAWNGSWGRAHVVVPIKALVADVLFRLLTLGMECRT
jgi:hypothetical protein